MHCYCNNTTFAVVTPPSPEAEDTVTPTTIEQPKCSSHTYGNEISQGIYVEHADALIVKFACFYNFHHVSGDMVHHCLDNGTWSGVEPLCVVDYYKERYRLSGFIIAVSSLLFLLFLGLDHLRFLRRRGYLRGEKSTRTAMFDNLRKAYISHNRLAQHYNVGEDSALGSTRTTTTISQFGSPTDPKTSKREAQKLSSKRLRYPRFLPLTLSEIDEEYEATPSQLNAEHSGSDTDFQRLNRSVKRSFFQYLEWEKREAEAHRRSKEKFKPISLRFGVKSKKNDSGGNGGGGRSGGKQGRL